MESVFAVQQAAWSLELDSKSKLVLMNILWRYNYINKKAAFPSQARISSDTGLSLNSVKRALNNLVDENYLIRVVNKDNGKANEYTPNFSEILMVGH